MSTYDTYFAYRYAERGDLKKLKECLTRLKGQSRWYVHNPNDDDEEDNIEDYDINDYDYDSDMNGAVAHHVAAYNGHAKCLEALLVDDYDPDDPDYEPDPDFLDSSCATPLHYSAQQGKTECTRLLIKFGAEVNHLDSDETTPLYRAAACGRPKCCQLLLAAGANVNFARNESDNYTALHAAAENGHHNVVEVLLDYNASINIQTSNGKTPLIAAAGEDKENAVKLLLSRGADTELTIESYSGLPITALGYAAMCNARKTLRILCDHGAIIDKNLIENIEEKVAFNRENDITKKMLLDEIENRLRRKAFEFFTDHYIENKHYKNKIYEICYPNDTIVALPSIGWLKAEKLRDKYYHEEIFFYIHLQVAKTIMKSNNINISECDITISECKNYFAKNDNKTFTLMSIITDRLKEVIIIIIIIVVIIIIITI
jgi:ankyrin repeat protein